MQALRRTDAQAQSLQSSVGLPAAKAVDHGPWPAGGEPIASPALLLRDHLAARLNELAQGDAATLAEPQVATLPITTRVAAIVGMSLSLWLVLYLGVAATI